MRILKICFQNNDKLDRIASIVATKDRWFIDSIKIYIFNCIFLLFFQIISVNSFYKDVSEIKKGVIDNLYNDPLEILLYLTGLFIAPSIIALIIKVSYKKTMGREPNIKKIVAKTCIASTICIPFLPIDLIGRGLVNMFPLELYGRLWASDDILSYEKIILVSACGICIILLIGIMFWWYKILNIKREKLKKKFYIYATLLAFVYTTVFSCIMSAVNMSMIVAQSYGTIDRTLRIIESMDNDNIRGVNLLIKYIDYDDNLSDEEKIQFKAVYMLYILKKDIKNKKHINAAKDYIACKEYDNAKKEVEQIVLNDDSKLKDVLGMANIYVNKLSKSSKNENIKKKNNRSIKLDKINYLLTLCPM